MSLRRGAYANPAASAGAGGTLPSAVPIYKTTLTVETNQGTTTFADVDIGTPHPQRLIVVAGLHGVDIVASCTIGGVAATMIQNPGGRTEAIAYALVPDGAAADIVYMAPTSLRKALAVYVAYPESPVPVAVTGVSSSATSTSNIRLSDVDVEAGGFLIFAGGMNAALGTFSISWEGTDPVIEDIDAQIESASYVMGHVNNSVTETADLVLSASATGNRRFVAASWR